MKFSEYLKEEKEVNLIGMEINDKLVTADTENRGWPGSFNCVNRGLTSLKGAPHTVSGIFCCAHNKLTSLEGAPSVVGGNFDCSDNFLTNLKDIHKIVIEMNGIFFCEDNPIKSHVLGLLLIPGVRIIHCNNDWAHILNLHRGKGRKGLIECQNELIDMGLEEYAQL